MTSSARERERERGRERGREREKEGETWRIRASLPKAVKGSGPAQIERRVA